jgi:Lipocalin-like domain
MESVAKVIIGTWRLVHSININSKGEREYPYGEDASGHIYYSDSGVMAVQISRKSRRQRPFESDSRIPGVLRSLRNRHRKTSGTPST